MPLSRRELLVAAGLTVVASGCASPPGPPPPPTPPARPALGTPEGLLGWVRQHPERASLLIDDGRGGRLERRADTARPVASASKVVHLTAYARAVATGRLDPAAPLPVREWERWYLPYTDGGAHPAALKLLGATSSGTVTWDQLIRAMIVSSDNAAPDLLRAELGDKALVDAAAAAGWSSPDLPSFLGEMLLITVPDRAGEPRREVAQRLAREFVDGGPVREIALEQTARELTDDDAAYRWAGGTPTGTVRQLAGLHQAAATGRLDSPVVSDLVRGHLERLLADRLPPGALGAGTKSGALPGVLSYVVTLRRGDGSVGVAAISLDGLTPDADEAFRQGTVAILASRLLEEPILLTHTDATLP